MAGVFARALVGPCAPTPHVCATKREGPGASMHRGLALSHAALSWRSLPLLPERNRIGSRPILVRKIAVALGRTTAVPPLTLVEQPIPMDSVVVIAPAVSLDPVHTTMGGVLRAEDYAALPVDRDYKSIISILPLANESYRRRMKR